MWCALALVLLLDASGSVTDAAWDLQVEAHADALADPAIARAMHAQGRTAVTVIGFAEAPRTLVPWRLVDDAADAARLAREVAGIERPGSGSTRTGAAVQHALRAIEAGPCDAERRIIDLVTDGPGDDAVRLSEAREAAIGADVRINVLVVETYATAAADWARAEAVTPGGFVMEAEGWPEFARALRRKIASEVAGR